MRERKKQLVSKIIKLVIAVGLVALVVSKLSGLFGRPTPTGKDADITESDVIVSATNRVSLAQKRIEPVKKSVLRGSYFSYEGGKMMSTGASIEIVHDFKEKFLEDEFSEQLQMSAEELSGFSVVSPSMAWFGGYLVTVLRVSVDNQREDEIRLQKNADADVGDNFMYMQKYDSNLRPISRGRVLVVPSVKGYSSVLYARAINPTLFAYRDKLYMSLPLQSQSDKSSEHMFIWDIAGSTVHKIRIEKERLSLRERNWVPFVADDKLYFVYTLDPCRILACEVLPARGDVVCKFVHQQVNRQISPFSDGEDFLRGATPFELYQWPYYVGVARSRTDQNGVSFRGAHLVVLRADLFHVVYASEPLNFGRGFVEDISNHRLNRNSSYVAAGGLILESEDSAAISVHISDVTSYVVRFRGLAAIFKNILKRDKNRYSGLEADARVIQTFIEYSMMTSPIVDKRRPDLR